MKKILIVATVLKKHIVQFHIPTIKMLKDMGWQVDVAAANDYEGEYDVSFCDNYYDIPFGRSPLSKTNKIAFQQLKQLINNGQYNVVHCHTPMGGFLTRFAAREARKNGTLVFYTVHGFHFYKRAPLINWILYYPIERYCSRLTDVLITIVKEDYEFAKKHMYSRTIEYIPGIGIDLSKYKRESDAAKQGSRYYTIMCTGELIKRKNHEAVIKAIGMLDQKVRCIICGDGELKEYLQEMTDKLGLRDRVKLLGYRNDIPRLLNDADLFILPSFQEGLSVALMEAIACKVPCLASDIRGNRDLLDEEALFDPKDTDGICRLVSQMIHRDNTEEVERNYRNLQKYSLQNVLDKMESIYTSFEQEN